MKTTNDRVEMGSASGVKDVGRGAIESRAYQIYQDSGCKQGCCEGNWLQAERELRTPSPAKTSGSGLVAASRWGSA